MYIQQSDSSWILFITNFPIYRLYKVDKEFYLQIIFSTLCEMVTNMINIYACVNVIIKDL